MWNNENGTEMHDNDVVKLYMNFFTALYFNAYKHGYLCPELLYK